MTSGFAPYTILRKVTAKVLLDMSEDEALQYAKERCFTLLRIELETHNEFEQWRLIHILRTRGYQALPIRSTCRVASNASRTTIRKIYREVKD